MSVKLNNVEKEYEMDHFNLSLDGVSSLITGASGGIGFSVCSAFLAKGAIVIATDLRKVPEMEELEKEYGDKFCFVIADLTKKDDMLKCINLINTHRISVLFNNAAIFSMAPFLESNTEEYEKVFSLNVKAMFQLMQAVASSIIQNKQKGSIVNLSSQAGRRGEPLVSHYCASKAAVISYTQSAALAFAKNNIRVNSIAPGVVDTPMWDHVDKLFAKYENRVLGEKKKLVSEAVPMGRMGSPEDIAGVALFLASNLSNYVTGQTINVDGGSVLS